MVLWERCIKWLENCGDFGRECVGNWKWSLLSCSMPSFDMMNSSCWNSCLSWVLVGLGLGLENSDEDFPMMLGETWIRSSENCSSFGRECIGDWLKMESVYSEVDWSFYLMPQGNHVGLLQKKEMIPFVHICFTMADTSFFVLLFP